MYRLQKVFMFETKDKGRKRAYKCEICLQGEDLTEAGEVVSRSDLRLLGMRLPFLRLVEGPIEWIASQLFYYVEGELKDLEIEAKLVRTCVWENDNLCVKFSDKMKATGDKS